MITVNVPDQFKTKKTLYISFITIIISILLHLHLIIFITLIMTVIIPLKYHSSSILH